MGLLLYLLLNGKSRRHLAGHKQLSKKMCGVSRGLVRAAPEPENSQASKPFP